MVPEADLYENLPRARKLSSDPDDVPYLAAALSIKGAVWADDPHFKEQSSVKAYATRELSKLLFA